MERGLLGNNFRLVQRIQLAASTKHARGSHGKRRYVEAAKDEGKEEKDENQVERKDGCRNQMVGS